MKELTDLIEGPSKPIPKPVRILALCDSPVIGDYKFINATGFGRVARNLITRWVKNGVSVDCWAIHFDGWGYENAPCRLFPGGSSGWNSPRKLEQFLRQLATGDYTHCWILMDPDALTVSNFPQQFRKLCREKNIRSLLYYPVDAPLEYEWLTMLDAVDVAATYTEYGVAETHRALARSLQPIEVVPHGVEPEFKPLGAGRTAYRKFEIDRGGKLIDFIKPGDFMLLWVAKNEWRKDPLRALEILAGLRAAGVPAKLVMRTAPGSAMGGVLLETAARQLGLTFGKEWCHIGDVPDTELCGLYNAADVALFTSMGEGWGLPVTEAMACHCPVAMGRHTSLKEIGEKYGSPVWLPLEAGAVCGADTRVRHRVDLAGSVAVLAEFADGTHGTNGTDGRVDPGAAFRADLDWDVIAARMLELLTGNKTD